MRYMAVLLIVGASLAVGWEYKNRLYARWCLLNELCLLILSVSSQIRNEMLPVHIILNNAAGESRFARRCSAEMSDSQFQDSWAACVDSAVCTSLRTEEKIQLKQLGKALGHGDIQAETAMLEQYYNYFSSRREQAAEERVTNGKTVFSCCALGGILIAVLLV